MENFSTTTGQHTNAVYGFTSMLINVMRDEEPTHIAVAFDKSRQTFRLEEYPEYKAKRNKTPDEFKSQLPLIQEVLDALHIEHLELEGYEADDIIATLTTQAVDAGFDVLILTGDRDSLQLVSEASTVLYPMRGVSELARMTPAAVEQKYAVPPHRYPEIAALVGEDSDNLPGIPGVGPKTAAKWINQFDGLDNVITHADQIKGKAGEGLRAHLSDVIRNRHLNRLVVDLPLPVAPTDLVRRPWDRHEVHTLFDGLEFRVLRDRLFESLESEEEIDDSGFEMVGTRLAPGEVAAWLQTHAGLDADEPARRTGVAVQGVWRAGGGEVWSVALAAQDGTAAWFDAAEITPRTTPRWRPGSATRRHPRCCTTRRVRCSRSRRAAGRSRGSSATPPSRRTSSVPTSGPTTWPTSRSATSSASCGRGPPSRTPVRASSPSTRSTARAAPASARRRCCRRVPCSTWRTRSTPRSTSTAGRSSSPRSSCRWSTCSRTSSAPASPSTPTTSSRWRATSREVKRAAEEAYAVIGKEINLGSPKQLQVVLFDELDMPKTKRTKTGYTTDADALQQLYVKTEHPFLLALLRHRDVSRLRQTLEGLLKTVADDGRIHTTFNQLIAATGRLSSTDPNLQNIPIRTEEGRRIREGFVVGEGYECLMTADYSQIEMRIMAHLSEDALLIEAFRSGRDFHSITAARVFGVPADDVTVEMRAKIKAMNYGLAYGLSAFGLSQQLQIEPSEARGLMDEYFETFGGIRDYLSGVVDEARRSGFTETIRGRRRYLPDLTSDNRQRREMAERMALNAPIRARPRT